MLYYVSIYDIAERGLYKILKKGVISRRKDGSASMTSPNWEIFADARSKIVLQASLNEFEAGQRLSQVQDRNGSSTVIFFAPELVEERIHAIRTTLGYEPGFIPNGELPMIFSSFRKAIDPQASLAPFDQEY